MSITLPSLLLLIVVSCLSTWIVRLFSLQRFISGFTAPFILSVWILLFVCSCWFPSLLLKSENTAGTQAFAFLQSFSLNIGQVMFQGGAVLTGLFFLLGILVNSRVNAVYTVLGALLPIPVALLAGVESAVLNAGLMGYNGVLCALSLWETRHGAGECMPYSPCYYLFFFNFWEWMSELLH